MWIFTPKWSVSVVSDREHDDILVVRARSQADMDAFIQDFELLAEGDVDQRKALVYGLTPGRHDYPYRVFVRRKSFGVLMQLMVNELDYDNFKERAEQDYRSSTIGQNRARSKMLYNIWAEGSRYGIYAKSLTPERDTAKSIPRMGYVPRNHKGF